MLLQIIGFTEAFQAPETLMRGQTMLAFEVLPVEVSKLYQEVLVTTYFKRESSVHPGPQQVLSVLNFAGLYW